MKRRKQQYKSTTAHLKFKNYDPLDDDQDYINAPEGSIAHFHKLQRLKAEAQEDEQLLEGGEKDLTPESTKRTIRAYNDKSMNKTYIEENSKDDILYLGGDKDKKSEFFSAGKQSMQRVSYSNST